MKNLVISCCQVAVHVAEEVQLDRRLSNFLFIQAREAAAGPCTAWPNLGASTKNPYNLNSHLSTSAALGAAPSTTIVHA